MSKHTIAIDPSINRLGLAVFRGRTLIEWKLVRPEGKPDNEYDKCLSIYLQVRQIRKQFHSYKTILEVPVHWEIEGFAARESGAMYKLCLIVGMIYSFGDVVRVPPHGWKKQLPKHVVRRRLMRVYPDVVDEKLDHNVVDAIGIGYWYHFQRRR